MQSMFKILQKRVDNARKTLFPDLQHITLTRTEAYVLLDNIYRLQEEVKRFEEGEPDMNITDKAERKELGVDICCLNGPYAYEVVDHTDSISRDVTVLVICKGCGFVKSVKA